MYYFDTRAIQIQGPDSAPASEDGPQADLTPCSNSQAFRNTRSGEHGNGRVIPPDALP